MTKTLFSRHLVAVDADHFKRVKFQTLRSRDGNRVDLRATAHTGIAAQPITAQQTKEVSSMNIQQLTEAVAGLSIAERTDRLTQRGAERSKELDVDARSGARQRSPRAAPLHQKRLRGSAAGRDHDPA